MVSAGEHLWIEGLGCGGQEQQVALSGPQPVTKGQGMGRRVLRGYVVHSRSRVTLSRIFGSPKFGLCPSVLGVRSRHPGLWWPTAPLLPLPHWAFPDAHMLRRNANFRLS